jgi:hypothetical protein
VPCGALAQLGERLICIQEVIGSIPIGSTNSFCDAKAECAKVIACNHVQHPDEVNTDLTRIGSVAQVVRAHA